MEIYFTSDTHFCHSNIIMYCNRAYSNVEEMNEDMIQNWNKVVRPNSHVYHLGDFAFTNKKNVKKVGEIIDRLNGKIHLCIGSHDEKTIKLLGHKFYKIAESFYLKSHDIFMSHYMHYVWPQSHYNSQHLFGHSHGRLNSKAEVHGKCMDVGVENHYYTPWSLSEIKDQMKIRPNNFNLVQDYKHV